MELECGGIIIKTQQCGLREVVTAYGNNCVEQSADSRKVVLWTVIHSIVMTVTSCKFYCMNRENVVRRKAKDEHYDPAYVLFSIRIRETRSYLFVF